MLNAQQKNARISKYKPISEEYHYCMQLYHYHLLDYYCAHRYLTKKKSVHFKLPNATTTYTPITILRPTVPYQFSINNQDFTQLNGTTKPYPLKSILKKQ